MRVDTSVESESGYRSHVVSGAVSLAEIEHTLKEIYGRQDVSSDLGSLWDVRDADLSGLSGAEIRQIISYVVEHRGASPGVRTAILVGRDLDFGLARMAEQFLEAESHSGTMVFRDRDAAVTWVMGGGEK